MRTITATLVDRTLFHVAAREMGDATAAIRIAQSSGVHDPWLAGMTTLRIPSRGPDTGGLPAPGTTPP